MKIAALQMVSGLNVAANLAQAALNALADRPYQAWLAGVFRKLHLELKRNGAEVAARAVIDVATR